MHNKGLYWNTCSSGFLSDTLYQNGSLSRMESKIFIFTGKNIAYFLIELHIHLVDIRQLIQWENYEMSQNTK